MLYEAILIAVIAGWLARGKLTNLARMDLRHIWLVFLAFAIEVGMQWLWSRGNQWLLPWRLYLGGLYYLLLLVFLWLNRRLPGVTLLAIGFLLNFLAIAANGGTMPSIITGLDPELVRQMKAGEWLTYTLLTESSKLPWLADVMVQPWPAVKTFSVGDILISLGVFWLVFKTMITSPGSGKLTSVRGMKIS